MFQLFKNIPLFQKFRLRVLQPAYYIVKKLRMYLRVYLFHFGLYNLFNDRYKGSFIRFKKGAGAYSKLMVTKKFRSLKTCLESSTRVTGWF